MKCQQVLFLFCVLCVFLVAGKKDEHQGNHHFREKHKDEKSPILNKHKKTEIRLHPSSHFKHPAYRDGNSNCHIVCGSASNTSDILVLYNGDVGLIAYLNDSAKAAAIQDYFTNVTVILNGQSGSAVVKDFGNNKFYNIEKNSQTEEVLWLSSKLDFKAFFKNLSSLQNFVKIGREHGKTINSTQEMLKQEAPELYLLDVVTSESNLTLSIQLSDELNSTLKFIFKGQGSFVLHKNIIWFIKVNLAFADIFRDNQTQLQSANLTLNLTNVYGASSGVEALVNLLTQIGTRVDLAKLLRNQLNSPEKLLDLLEKLSGGSNEGVDGIITVLVTIIKAVNGHASISDVITAISNYNSDGDSSSLNKVVDETLELIESQNRQYNNSEAFRGIVTVLKAINDHNLVFRNVNISDVITLLVSRNPITTVQIVIRIFSRFANSDGFTQTIHTFIESLNGTNGSNIISRLFPGANLDNARHFLTSVVSHIPVIGNLFNASASSIGRFNVSNIINSNPITGFIQNAAGNGSVGNVVSSFSNASSGIVHGIENAIHNFAGEFFGSGNGEASSSTSASNSGTESSNSSTESSNSGNSSAPPPTVPAILPTLVSSNNATGNQSSPESNGTPRPPSLEGTPSGTSTSNNTNSPGANQGTGNNGTVPSPPPEGNQPGNAPPNNATGSPNSPGGNGGNNNGQPSSSESPTSNNGTVTPNASGSAGAEASNPNSSKQASNVRKGNIYQLHEKKGIQHEHLHASNKKENAHPSHKLQEKGHHSHKQESNRKETLHLKHKLQEKDAHHGHLQKSDKNAPHGHNFQEKDIIAKKDNKDIHQKKHEDHHNQHS